ncbi:MAG: hypothetical protein ACT6QS_00520 [Flavobacteriales bacterium]
MRILLFVLLLFPFSLHAQKKPLLIRLSLFNESTALPFTRFFTLPLHPGIQAGTEFAYLDKPRHYVYQTLQAGYLYHRYLYQAAYLQSEIGYDLRLGFGLNIKALFGLGYMHSFATQKEYRLVNGEYLQKPDRGNARINPSLSLGLGYRIYPKRAASPEIFVLYQSWVEYPYSPGFIPAMTHISLHLGSKFFISRK